MSEKNSSLVDRPAARVVFLFAALFLIGLVTRMPAWMFPQYYALHGVLASPFCAALALWHFRRGGTVGQLVLATVLLAAVLGAMSAAMGLGFAAVALVMLVAGLLRGGMGSRRAFALAVLFGAVDYPCAVMVGVALGTYGASAASVPVVTVLLILSIALAFFGACLVPSSQDA
ncbi:hypothetical protein [uncultured Adlercreutzia sp.]|uniref:hypothetical protein n=1 Tax=uncultured Adlercreutzia sp. TaxID=875803 RepID=UPI0025F384CF|nr:hypothetical protein [uncultured Adlercreutzia sp.]MCI9261103.1 hypothetical protein [Eggerthellaceae bacterium]